MSSANQAPKNPPNSFVGSVKTDATRKVMQPRLEEIEKARVEAAQRVLKTEPGKLGVATPISLETAEDLERAARALQEEARRRAEAVMRKVGRSPHPLR